MAPLERSLTIRVADRQKSPGFYCRKLKYSKEVFLLAPGVNGGGSSCDSLFLLARAPGVRKYDMRRERSYYYLTLSELVTT